MKRQYLIVIATLVLAALLVTACKPTVPQEEYDLVVADLAAAEAEAERLEGELAEAQSQAAEAQAQAEEAQSQVQELGQELEELRSREGDAGQELQALQEKVGRAVLAADILDGITRAVLGAEQMPQEEALQLFLELSERVEASDDEVLKEKFQAVVLTFGGQAEGIDLVQYLVGVIAELGEEP